MDSESKNYPLVLPGLLGGCSEKGGAQRGEGLRGGSTRGGA